MQDLKLTTETESSIFEKNLIENNLAPLWKNFKKLVTTEPEQKYIPWMWSYKKYYKYLLNSAKVVSMDHAERRVLIFRNPGMPYEFSAIPAIYAGVQILMPGENGCSP